ncbi:MAG: Peroxiredoxin [Chloroflexi bacterium]|jgi:cytochrome oxidase Cu insertion factor (SCO1/SenC/PrrC family)|nr:MAG: Peroxiredoxin [Chloroflexota bacterium]
MAKDANIETPFLGKPYNYDTWDRSGALPFFQAEAARVGDVAPDFTLPLAEGEQIALSALRGKPVMIEFGSIT